ncbi:MULTISPECIES: hypothetical protein [Enterococcus]|uniref:DUF1433 domain-containing protein n=1 Tax=Candidatus Enterococcus mangumiae TaxID=2230878 RepID=A0ABZ2SST1_9ENTE|nr:MULTISPECIES: hypothetical protein [unclassified Enterococcus]
MEKKKWLIPISIGMLVMVLTVIAVKEISEPTEKEKQINFLKAHEKEMTEYINQSEGEKVTAINYDWNNVNQVVIGNGLPSGAGKKIQIFGFVNNKPYMDFRLDIELNQNNMPDMSTLHYGQQINIEELNS